MRYLIAILVGVAILEMAGCSYRTKVSASVAKSPVVVTGQTRVVSDIAQSHLTSTSRKIAGEIAKPVSSMREGLVHVQKISRAPIQAIAEQGGWFYYATSIVADQATGEPKNFIAGYAIKKGDRQIIEWSV